MMQAALYPLLAVLAFEPITRLRPAAFPELPAAVAGEMERRGCTVPQPWGEKRPANVIRGQFARPGQTDWAVLCSIQGVSSILVFWNGSTARPASIAPAPDETYVQNVDGKHMGFSRGIVPVDRAEILRNYQAYGGPKPPPIDHQGIDDAFVGKASVAWYFFRGKWLQLSGAD